MQGFVIVEKMRQGIIFWVFELTAFGKAFGKIYSDTYWVDEVQCSTFVPSF